MIIVGAVWRDDRNGPRERARAVTLSQGLSGGVTPDFAGPGRYYPPRSVTPQQDPWPFTGHNPPGEPIAHQPGSCACGVRHTPTEAVQLNVPSPDRPQARVHETGWCWCRGLHTDIEADKLNRLAAAPNGLYRDADRHAAPQQDATGYQRKHQAQPSGEDVMRDLLGREHWMTGEPSPAVDPICAYEHCSEILQPAKHSGGGTDNKKYCSAAHRARASEQRKRQAVSLS